MAKDNPVASIDEVFKEFDKDENGHLWEYDSRGTVENFIKFYKEKVNAVETNKVQPKNNAIKNCPYDFTARCTLGRCDCK